MEEQGPLEGKLSFGTADVGSIIVDKGVIEGTFEVIDISAEELAKLGDQNGEITVIDGSQLYKIPCTSDYRIEDGESVGISYEEVEKTDTSTVRATSDEEEDLDVDGQVDLIGAYVLEGGQVTFIQEDSSPRKGTLVKLEDGTTYLVTQDEEDETSSEEVTNPRPHECKEPGCKRSYKFLHHLKIHTNSHSRPYACPISGCGKSFSTVYSRTAHIRTHTGEKPYRCTFESCKKGFKTSGDLQKHIRTHTGERPFTCPVEGCNKSFTTSNIRKVHIRTHTGEKPYICDYPDCERSFASSTNYKNHMRIHSGEKPYCCSVSNCFKRFTEYSSLYKHQLVHSHMKRHLCPLCNKSYRQLSSLLTHKRTNHGIITADDGTEIALEHVIGVGEDGSKSFKNIASNLLTLKRERNALVTVEDDGVPIFIVSQLPEEEGEEEEDNPLDVVRTGKSLT